MILSDIEQLLINIANLVKNIYCEIQWFPVHSDGRFVNLYAVMKRNCASTCILDLYYFKILQIAN